MSRVQMVQCDFSAGSDGQLLGDVYGTDPLGGLEIRGGGAQHPVGGGWRMDVFVESSTPETDRRPTLSDDQYAAVEVRSTANNFNPMIMCRAAIISSMINGYTVDPRTYSNTMAIGKWQENAYTLLATGEINSPSVGDTIDIEARQNVISAGRNGNMGAATTDTTFDSGDPALAMSASPGVAVVDNLDAGAISLKVHDFAEGRLRARDKIARKRRAITHRTIITGPP